MTVEAVLFDYGGVLTTPTRDSIAAWLAADKIEPRSFTRVLRAWLGRDTPDGSPIHRLETGELPPADFDVALAGRLSTVDGHPINSVGVLARLFAGIRLAEGMFTLAEDLSALGVRVGVLSNSWGNDYPRERLAGLFDPIVISAEVGLRKPQAAIFTLALDRLGLAAERVVFVDDAEANLLGAEAVGLGTLLHVDPAATRVALAELVPGLHPQSTKQPHDRSSA